MKNSIYLLTLLGLSILSVSCKDEKQTSGILNSKNRIPNSLETVELKKSNPTVLLKLAGELLPDQETALFAKVPSYVKKLYVDIGSQVTEGQILMVLEAPELEAQIAHAKAKIHSAEAVYTATEANYDRMFRASQTKGAIAQDALDRITSQKLSDQAQVQGAQAAYREIQDVHRYLIIRAPFNGMVTDRNVDVGAFVNSMGGTPLLVVQNTSKLRLSLSVPEASVPYLNIGDTIRFRVAALPDKDFIAKISRKSGTLDLKLRSEKIEADFINPHKELKPFMMAESNIPLQNSKATFFIPRSALVESNMGVYVVKNEGGKARFVMVKKGRMKEGSIEIFGALSEGDHIIKKAGEELLEGTVIN